jgi:hypothetical protein
MPTKTLMTPETGPRQPTPLAFRKNNHSNFKPFTTIATTTVIASP